MAKQRVAAFAQRRGVVGFDGDNALRECVDGVAAEFGARAVGGLAGGDESQPEIALVGGDDLAAGRLADECEVGFYSQLGKGARAGLVALFVHQADENDLGFARAAFALGHVLERAEHRGDAAFRVARPPAVQLVALFCGAIDFRVVAADGVEVRREDDAVPRLA